MACSGNRSSLYLEDGATTDSVAAAAAAKLVERDKVDVIFGGIYSSTRQAIKGPAVEKGGTLYIYPEQYEGRESHPLIFCTGPVPAQQLDPLIPWLMQKTGAKTFYLPSADYIWPHVMNEKVRQLVTANGGTIVGEEYYPLDRMEYGETVEKIMSSGAEVVFNTIVPPGVLPFFQLLHDAGFQKRGGQLICTYFDENLLGLMPPEHVEGLYGCLDYYQNIGDAFSKKLLARYNERFPGALAIHGRQCVLRSVSRNEALGGGGQGGRLTSPRRRHRGARSRKDRRGTGRPRRNGAGSASRPHEYVHRAGEERTLRDRQGPRRHRSTRGDGPKRREAQPRIDEMNQPCPLNERLLRQRFIELEAARNWAPHTLPELERFIRNADDYELFRVNPIQYASANGLMEADGIELFVHAAKVGLFEMDWLLICAYCPQVAGSFRELDQVHPRFQCAFCNALNDVALDDYIQVTFTVSSGVRDIAFRHPEMLSVEDYYLRYNFSKGFKAPHGMTHEQLVAALSRGFADIEAHQQQSFDFEVTAGRFEVLDLSHKLLLVFFANGDAVGTAQDAGSARVRPLRCARPPYGAA